MTTNDTRNDLKNALEEERRPHDGLIARLREHAGDYRAHALGIPMSRELVWDARHAIAWRAAERLEVRNTQVQAVLELCDPDFSLSIPDEIKRRISRAIEEAGA